MAGVYDMDAVHHGCDGDGLLVRLINLNDDLGQKDIDGIKFLCRDFIPVSRLEKCTKGIDIFQYLIERKLITAENIDLLLECLCRINRFDCIKKLNFKPDDVKEKVNKASKLKHFRVMLFTIAEDISDEEVCKIRYFLQNIPGQNHSISRCTTMVEAFISCEKLGIIDENNIERIYEMMKLLKRDDLVDEVNEYAKKAGLRQSQNPLSGNRDVSIIGNSTMPGLMVMSESPHRLLPASAHPLLHGSSTVFPHSEMTQPGCLQNREQSVAPLTYDIISALNASENFEFKTSGAENTYTTSQNSCGQVRNGAFSTLKMEMAQKTATGINYSGPRQGSQMVPSGATMKQCQEQTELLDRYKMDAVPRGICLIVNNKKFYQEDNDPNRQELSERQGTDIDCEKLHKLFIKLHFEVEIKQDQTDHEICMLMEETSRKDHSKYDCFVCCILTHGTEGKIYGSNKKEVPISKLARFFWSDCCLSLAGKPKVFFFQACQGTQKQSGYKMEHTVPDIVEDAPSQEMMPNEADFLFGFATVAGYSSYRSRSKGSWYINKLVDMLEAYHERMDVLSILVKVNNEVCKEDAHIGRKVYKQTPSPLFTLRKQLYF